jgi:tetratricopeptide (TPR) repeat protein
LVGRDVKVIDSTTPEMYTRDDVIELTDIAAQHPEEVSSAVRDLAARYATWSDVQTLSGTADQSGERMAQLEALGYMTSGTPTVGQGFGEGLPDPVKHLPALREMERARSALQRGDLPGAEAAARALIAAEPGLVEAKSLLAQILSRSGQTDAAMELLTTLDAAQPATGTKVAMASLLLQRGQPRRSLPLYAAALETDPYYAPAWTGYLHALFLSGEFQQLEAELNRAHSRIPDLQAAQTLGGVLHAARGKWGPAGTMLSAAQAREPYQPFLNLGLGMVAMSAGEAEAAEGHFTEEIALYPPAIPARKELVKLYAGQSRYAEQLEQLEPLVRFQPEDTLNHRARAQALFNLGRYPEAKAALKGCLDREPEDDACLLLLANTQGKLGETEAAKATFEKAKVAHAAKGPR